MRTSAVFHDDDEFLFLDEVVDVAHDVMMLELVEDLKLNKLFVLLAWLSIFRFGREGHAWR